MDADKKLLKLINRVDKEKMEELLLENGHLSQLYTLSSKSRGRKRHEEPSTWRTCFERDRDRILYSMAYRRLRDKAQVYILPINANLTTRLVHTEEVYQVAYSICNFLGLNRTLAEAIARGHDVGHTPFGHVGEKVLTNLMRQYLDDDTYVFHHAKYGLEMVDRIEKDGEGLNLTEEVRDGILKHTLGATGLKDATNLPFTPEGRVVMYADKIAYTCGDLEDAVRVGVINRSDVPVSIISTLGDDKSQWLGNIIKDVVESSVEAQEVAFRGKCFEAFEELRAYMYANVYGSGEMREQRRKAERAVQLVFQDVMEKNLKKMEIKEAAQKTLDQVASMTDVTLTRYFRENFMPDGVF
jgi:dGTPase